MKCSKSINFKSIAFALIFLLFLLNLNVWATGEASQLAEHFLKKIPVNEVDPNMTVDQAMEIQDQFVAIISKTMGPIVGYKAGLTNSEVQKKFGVSHPVRGTLLEKMLLENGTVLPADFGARPMCEGDLILRVGSDSINQAKTIEEALRCIDAVIPLIELPDLVYAEDVKINGPALIAINVGARYGVVGEPIPVEATREWSYRLKNFTLQILDENGNLLLEGQGSNLMDDPLNVVLWLKDSLTAEGRALKRGDLISLGTITKMMPAKPGTTVRARYIGLDPNGPVGIFVKFK